MGCWPWRRIRSVLPLVFDLLLVVVLSALDVRDLYYKINWIGPYDSFSFTALSSRTFDTKPALTTVNFTQQELAIASSDALLASTSRDSGWPSLLSNCQGFYPAGASLFIGGMGTNCTVYKNLSTNNTDTVRLLYMSASLRADSMAWAACKLLYRHRKPAVCHDHIVTGFQQRYGFQDVAVARKDKVLPFSDAEAEALSVLRVIAKSEPLTRATCVEGFAYTTPTLYKTSIFGCGAPNSIDSAFIGVHATAFKYLHQDKAWLTVDTVNIMGFRYIMRQNVKSEFMASLNAQTGALELAPKTITNFSSSGTLYTLMILIDTVLLVINMWSALEIVRLMVVPLLYAHLTSDENDEDHPLYQELVDDYKAGFSSSLYRSRVVVVLLSISQLLSWVIVFPNSVIFTWSTGSKYAKIQAYLSSLRLWVLVLVLFNELWDLVVLLSERFAYAVASQTYIATYEILAIGAAVSYDLRTEIFGVGNAKYALELQRTKDTSSFIKRLTLQNAYNEELDYQLNTPANIVWIMYKPLVKIILWSVFYCVVLLLVRFIYYRFVKPLVIRKCFRQSAYTVNGKILASDGAATGTNDGSDHTPKTVELRSATYERLPLEEQLNDPIRARCLVRGSFAVEAIRVDTKTKRPRRYILPAYFLEAGVLVDQYGDMRTRHGFFKFLEPRIKFEDCMPAETSEALRKMATLRKRRTGSVTSSKPLIKEQ